MAGPEAPVSGLSDGCEEANTDSCKRDELEAV